MIILIAGLSATMSSASSDAIAGVTILLRDVYIMVMGTVPPKDQMINYSRAALVVVIALALLFSLTSNDVISYITKMISTVMSGMFVCGVLGRFWGRYNWQGAIATLIGASAASFSLIFNDSWMTYWGNPVLPSVATAFVMGMFVSIIIPRNAASHEQALLILNEERSVM